MAYTNLITQPWVLVFSPTKAFMKYSTRQQSYAQYLLRRIGFQQQKDIDLYLQQLLSSKGRYHFNPKAKNPFQSWKYSAKACVDTLVQELELKKAAKEIPLLNGRSSVFTPTNLARYTFCPAAFSIGNSFELKPSGEDTLLDLGTQLHESLRLSKQRAQPQIRTDPFYRRAWQNPAIHKILRSELIYTGHGQQAAFFHNSSNGFYGQPDYIFRDKAGVYFVVEEKFIRYQDPMNPSAAKISKEEWAGILTEKNKERQKAWEALPFYFFKNHILQVLAYLANTQEYPLAYGYLVYWLYDFKDGEAYVHKAGVKKLSLDATNQTLYEGYLNSWQSFVKKGQETFDVAKVNPKKCAACSLSPYCMHKTKQYTELNYPYRREDLKLFPAQFPANLRHQI